MLHLTEAAISKAKQFGGIHVFVDPTSSTHLQDVTIDFVDNLQGSGFTFNNPNSAGSCGCGESFSV